MFRDYVKADGSWSDTKAKLIRSMFWDKPPLTPIQEGPEPSSPSSREHSPLRAYSPLPELVVEVEPNRHDEPEEYYLQLEKLIRTFYRKLFHEGRNPSSITSDVADSESPALLENIQLSEESTRTSEEPYALEAMRGELGRLSAGSIRHQVLEESPQEPALEECEPGARLLNLSPSPHSSRGSDRSQYTSHRMEDSDSYCSVASSDAARCEDAGTQTSDPDEKNMRILQNLFVGRPIVHRIITSRPLHIMDY